jgi:uncharacterized protein (TIGR04141 family)
MGDQAKRVRYTIHLLREGTDVDEVIRRPDATPLEPTTPLPFNGRAFLVANRQKSPAWVKPLKTYFQLDDLNNQSNSFVLILEAGGRHFAYTAGYGHTIIDKHHVEHGFGVRVAASIVDPSALTTWENRTIEGNTRQRRTQLSRGGDLVALGVELDPTVVRNIAGATSIEGVLRVSGTDSVTVKSPHGVEQLRELCERLLAAYESEDWKERFPELEALERLPGTHPLVPSLNEVVDQRLENRSTERLALAPLRVLGEELDGYAITGPRGISFDLGEELSLEDLYAQVPADIDLRKLRFVPLDTDGNALDQRAGLRQYLVAEVELEGRLYALSEGQWYSVDADFRARIERDLLGIDVSSEFDLPPWGEEGEAAYVTDVAQERHWTVLDQKNIQFGGRQKVEPCDLVTPEGDLVYVKMAESSKVLSHLSKQAEVATELLIDDKYFRDSLCAAGGLDVEQVREKKIRFILAIGTPKPGPLSENLFFFSKVGIRQTRRHVERTMGYRIGLAKVERVLQPEPRAGNR